MGKGNPQERVRKRITEKRRYRKRNGKRGTGIRRQGK